MDDFAAARLTTRVHDDVELARDHLHAVEVLLVLDEASNVAYKFLFSMLGYAESPKILDAPVSGGVPAATEAGKLTFMVGGLEEAYLAAKSLLQVMGEKQSTVVVLEMARQAAKICNNMAMAISMLGVSEAFALGQNLGIKATTATDIFNCSSARCWSSNTNNPVPELWKAKDLDLAMASASGVGFKCPMGSNALEIYRKLCEDGCELKDFSCAFQHYYSRKNEE
ncbi:putative 3-hydroxyisobutyrate dehydrogenase, mitochondrial [Zea mays]|uniref:3-hydroxyisobutyrate dehydrogenase n=1 Tax=Zea mays TaxID=4577 RepID=A0A317YJK2_MAIZE|nr:putative 3-hydroxyisobutyrate dehydrogenase, mitochondrial [Zea mays]